MRRASITCSASRRTGDSPPCCASPRRSGLTLIAAVAALAGNVAAGSATLALPVASRQPCIVVLAMIPAAVALLGGYVATIKRGQTK